MMKKTHRQERSETGRLIDVKFEPTINEGPATVHVMKKEIHRLEDTVKRQKGEISTLRQLLINQSNAEYWEVPG